MKRKSMKRRRHRTSTTSKRISSSLSRKIGWRSAVGAWSFQICAWSRPRGTSSLTTHAASGFLFGLRPRQKRECAASPQFQSGQAQFSASRGNPTANHHRIQNRIGFTLTPEENKGCFNSYYKLNPVLKSIPICIKRRMI